jgi:hypothetical protein
LRDAALLTTLLTDVAGGEMTLAHAKDTHESEMLRYGFEAAANSTKPYFAQATRTKA